MRKVGTIKEIWRYPVKGMAGESLPTGNLGTMGLAGDRIWALRDNARCEIQSCKFRPELLLCAASCRDGQPDQVDVLFPDGTVVGSEQADIHERLSALTGHASTLEPLRPAADHAFYRRHGLDDNSWLTDLKATFERESNEPLPGFFDDFTTAAAEFISIPGTFFLVTPLHLVTTATLAHLKKIHPQSDWDVRRFRPNFVIETEPGAEGLLEQEWVGKKLTLGDAIIDCPSTTPRCGAITRAQRDFAADKTILRTVVNAADQNVGIYGVTVNTGAPRVGDPVYVS
jgi:uncharacterized protein YcbX